MAFWLFLKTNKNVTMDVKGKVINPRYCMCWPLIMSIVFTSCKVFSCMSCAKGLHFFSDAVGHRVKWKG